MTVHDGEILTYLEKVVSAIVACSTARKSTILESADSKTMALVTAFAPNKISA